MRYVFIDFEASSLWAGGSFPIEVGWRDEHGLGQSMLIRRLPTWPYDWDPRSEDTHGISRETLDRDGLLAEHVARTLHEILSGLDAQAVSDAPALDAAWLRALLDTAGLPIPLRPLRDLDEILGLECLPLLGMPLSELAVTDLSLDIVVRAHEAEGRVRRRRHRALEDAQGLAFRWRTVRQEVRERTGSG